MRFRKIRGIRVPYERQGMIFFTLATYDTQPDNVRRKIDGLIRTVCKEDPIYIAAMRDWLIKQERWELVSLRIGVNEGTLLRYRRKLYELW